MGLGTANIDEADFKEINRLTEIIIKKQSIEGYCTVDELRSFFENLSDADIIRLDKIAWKLRLIDNDWEPGDLIGESIKKVLEGKRNCPKNVKLMTFFVGVMKSVASDWRRKKKVIPITFQNPDSLNDFDVNSQDSEKTPEMEIIEKEEEFNVSSNRKKLWAAIDKLFKDDDNAQWIIEGIKDELQAEEIRHLSGMDETTYASTRRRMRRKIDKNIPMGECNEK